MMSGWWIPPRSTAAARTPAAVTVRVLQRILALTPAIGRNDHAGQPVKRLLIAYDHEPLEIDHRAWVQAMALRTTLVAQVTTSAHRGTSTAKACQTAGLLSVPPASPRDACTA